MNQTKECKSPFKHTCKQCNQEYSSKGTLDRHLWQVHNIGEGTIFKCEHCEYTSKRKGDLKKHQSHIHDTENKV